VAHRVATGRLHLVLPRVYLVGRPQRDALGRMMAAALYFKGDALVTGEAAAEVWGMRDTTQRLDDRAPIHVLLANRNAFRPPGVVVHRTTSLAAPDIRRRNGIPVTSPARTLLDLAGLISELELESALSAALRANIVRPSQLSDVIERNPYWKGVGRLRGLLEQTDSLHDTRSRYERKFLALLRSAELPLPLTNTWVAGKFVDGVWPELKLVLELDGYGVHGKRDRFESDRVRDQHLLIADHHVIRVTARQVDFGRDALIARTASVITTLRLRAAGSPAADAQS
jgi:very-short-patch-repair endonuclease